MGFNLKEAWHSVCLLAGGDTIYHASPIIIQTSLPNNGELEMTNAENASVFVPHFDRVFNNHIPIYWPMLYKIKQRDVTEELDPQISRENIEIVTINLANDKAPGLNGVLPNAFKLLNEKKYHLASTILHSIMA